MQSEIDAQYIGQLGAPPELVTVTGNTKFDQTYTDITENEKKILREEMGPVSYTHLDVYKRQAICSD